MPVFERSAERANPLNMVHTLSVSAITVINTRIIDRSSGKHESRVAPPPHLKTRDRWGVRKAG